MAQLPAPDLGVAVPLTALAQAPSVSALAADLPSSRLQSVPRTTQAPDRVVFRL